MKARAKRTDGRMEAHVLYGIFSSGLGSVNWQHVVDHPLNASRLILLYYQVRP